MGRNVLFHCFHLETRLLPLQQKVLKPVSFYEKENACYAGSMCIYSKFMGKTHFLGNENHFNVQRSRFHVLFDTQTSGLVYLSNTKNLYSDLNNEQVCSPRVWHTSCKKTKQAKTYTKKQQFFDNATQYELFTVSSPQEQAAKPCPCPTLGLEPITCLRSDSFSRCKSI